MSSSELREALRAGVAGRLVPGGWHADRFEDMTEMLLACAGGSNHPLLVDRVFVGLSYEPLRRLYPLLGAHFCRFLPQGELDEGLPREAEDGCLFEMRDAADVDRVAERLSALIEERAVPMAQPVARLEDLIDEFRPYRGGSVLPALLAAAGRLEEAWALLDTTTGPDPDDLDGEDSRAVRQLRRWIDSGGDPSLIPAPPPLSQHPPKEERSFGEMTADARARTRARKHASEEVRREGEGRSRAEQRAMLERALAKQGHTEPALWIEQTLDHLWDSPADRASARADALKELGRIGLGVARAIRTRSMPDLSPPDGLNPPPHACYALRDTDRWIQVDLDPQALDWLERVHQATPHGFGISVPIPAWLDHDPGAKPRIAVHLGAHRVGHLSEDDTTGSPPMDAARFRDERPTVNARLVSRPQPTRFLLEIAAPD